MLRESPSHSLNKMYTSTNTNDDYLEVLPRSLNRLHVIASAAKQSKTLNGGLDYEIASSGSLACARDKSRNDT